MIPDDHLQPIWRCEPNHGSGTFTVGLDPREADFVLTRGWATLDGIRYRVNQEGCDLNVQGDGRMMVRCEIDDKQGEAMLLAEADALRRINYNMTIGEEAWAD